LGSVEKHFEGAVMARPQLQKSILSLKGWLFTPGPNRTDLPRAADVHSDDLIIELETQSHHRQGRKPAKQRFAILQAFPLITFLVRCELIPRAQGLGSMTCKLS
jgi:hypothetical protein